jgi:diaminopropionate ammonia-lyase
MHRLHELGVRAGPCGAAALAGVRAALEDSDHRAALAVNEESALVLISTDGPV